MKLTDTAVVDGVIQSAAETGSSLSKALGFSLGKLTVSDLLSTLLLFLLCYAAGRILRHVVRRALARSRLSESVRHFFNQLLRFTVDFIILLIVADSLGIPVTSLLAVFSLLGLAVSLSIQSLLGNLINGIVLLFNKPFDVGDYIEVKGVSGTVKQIALFQTKINTIDNKLIYIPNSDVASSTIINYTGEALRRVDLSYDASFESPAENVRAAILACAASLPEVLTAPAPEVVVESFGTSNVRYTARLWAKNADCIAVRDGMNDRILTYYARYGAEMSYQKIVLRQ